MALALVSGAFLLGSLPFSFWVARVFGGVDLRAVGSGNPGATNVLRVVGWGPALLALILDMGKGALPVAAAARAGSGEPLLALTAVAAILGHIVSPFLRLRGGKGVATAAGSLAILNPLATIAGVGVFLVTVAWKRYVSLASILAAGAIALLAMAGVDGGGVGRPGQLATIAVSGLVVVRHAGNAKRLVAGKERRLGEGVDRV